MKAAPGDDDPVTERPRDLEISPCRSACSWSQTGEQLAGERLFACAACGSEWVASEPWIPVDWEGFVPDAVQRERAGRRGPSTSSRQ